MKRLRLLGLTLLAVFALGGVAAATASAVEPGVLTLAEAAELKVLHEEKNESLANTGTFEGGGQTLTCKKLWVLPAALTVADKKHWTLIKDLDLHISECKLGTLACNTAGDAKEVLLILVDWHFVAFLEGTKLIPGVLFLVLNSKLESLPIVITCGLVNVELKGVVTAKTAQLTETLTASKEGEESKRFTVEAVPGLKCDTSDELCKKLLEPNPLLLNVGKGFEAATLTTQAQKMSFSADVTWDF